MRRLLLSGLAGLAALSLSGCGWSRFDDVTSDAPVVLLKQPNDMTGFGVSLAIANSGTRSQLFVGGAVGVSNGGVFELGTGDAPTIDAIDTGSCTQGQTPCFMSSGAAGLGLADITGGNKQLCFLFGVGSTNTAQTGVLARCDDDTEYALDVPQPVLDGLIAPAIANAEPAVITLSSDRKEAPAVVAGDPTTQHAWFYWELSPTPVPLLHPGTTVDVSYGKSVVSVRYSKGRVFAVAAPDAGHVWLFRTTDGSSVASVGCLGGEEGFGRALAAGPVSSGTDDLVIAGTTTVSVLSGEKLGALPDSNSTDCSLAALPTGTLVTSFHCGQTPDIAGCRGSDFGASLAVGDLDGDGDGEVVVGAPKLSVRGTSDAGALLVYDVEGEDRFALSDVMFISSAEDGDKLGSSLATPRVGDRDIVAAGAPGNTKTALFYCSSLLPEGQRGARCQ